MAHGRRPSARAALEAQEAVTDRAVASFTATTDSLSVRQSASPGGEKAIAGLRSGLAGLPALRAGIAAHAVAGQQAFTAYSDMIAASYGVLEQAIIQEGNSTQVLPGIAVIELAISNEYLQQESALLNGDFAVRAFPASAHQAFARLVGAHRLLYAQSYSYLDPADRASLDHDVSPHAAATVTALEDRLVGEQCSGPPSPGQPGGLERRRRHGQRADPAGRGTGRGAPVRRRSRPGQQQAARPLPGSRPGPGRRDLVRGPVGVDRRQPGPPAAPAARLGAGHGQRPPAGRGAAPARRRGRGRRRAGADAGSRPGRDRPGQGGLQHRAAGGDGGRR